MELIATGERATWPKIEMIRIQTRISRTLEDILSRFEDRQVGYAMAALRKKAI
jgi:NTE family protein